MSETNTGPEATNEASREQPADKTTDHDPATRFGALYANAEAGGPAVPWDRDKPHEVFTDWVESVGLDGTGQRALVIGSGVGLDSEYLGMRGFDVVAFDIVPGAIELVGERYPDSAVDYRVADLLDLPAEWRHAFDFVLEKFNVQTIPPADRQRATEAVAGTVGVGGLLLVIETCVGSLLHDPPPWPLSREEIEAFAVDGLQIEGVEAVPLETDMNRRRWRATFRRGDPIL